MGVNLTKTLVLYFLNQLYQFSLYYIIFPLYYRSKNFVKKNLTQLSKNNLSNIKLQVKIALLF